MDLLSRRSIIIHFRDLANVGPLLDMDLVEVQYQFRKRLNRFGWGLDAIYDMEIIAYSRVIYELHIPHVIRSRGSRTEYLKNFARHK